MSATFEIQAVPGAPRNQIVGIVGGRIKVKIHAPPVEGKANAELVRFLAETLGVRPNRLAVVRGESGRVKVIRLEGADAGALVAGLARRAAEG